MLPHLDTEAYLVELAREDPSFSYTIVRIGVYSESYPIYTASFDINAPPSPSDGNNHGNDDGRDTIRIPHDGAGPGISWAKRSELGEAVAKLMVQYVEHPNPETFEWRNKMMVLGGPKEYSLKETVDVLSDVVGRELRITEIPVDEYVNLPAVKVSGRRAGCVFLTVLLAPGGWFTIIRSLTFTLSVPFVSNSSLITSHSVLFLQFSAVRPA